MTREKNSISRRHFLMGQGSAVPDSSGKSIEYHCISSAVVSALPERQEEVAGRLSAIPGVEVHAREHGKIIVTIEGPGSSAVGSRLAEISVMDGVIAANMVFEHIEPTGSSGA